MTKVELNEVLFSLLGSELMVSMWWHTPNQRWSGETPYRVWNSDPEAVEEYITYFIDKQNET